MRAVFEKFAAQSGIDPGKVSFTRGEPMTGETTWDEQEAKIARDYKAAIDKSLAEGVPACTLGSGCTPEEVEAWRKSPEGQLLAEATRSVYRRLQERFNKAFWRVFAGDEMSIADPTIYVGDYEACKAMGATDLPLEWQRIHPADFAGNPLPNGCWTNNPLLVDCYKPEAVLVVRGEYCQALSDHPEYEAWQAEMGAGELWSMWGEAWVKPEGKQ